MACFTQSSWFSSIHTTKTKTTQKPTKPNNMITSFLPTKHIPNPLKPFKISTFALNDSNEAPLPEPPSSNASESAEEVKSDRIKLAFEMANKYKKSLQLNNVNVNQEIKIDPVAKTAGFVSGNEYQLKNEVVGNGGSDGGGDEKEVPEAVRIAMEKAREYQKSKGIVDSDESKVESEKLAEDGDSRNNKIPEALRISMEKAKDYKKNKGRLSEDQSNEESNQLPDKEVPEAVRIAVEKAREYKKNKGAVDSNSSSVDSVGSFKLKGANGGAARDLGSANKSKDLTVSSIDFVGLNFADKKKSRGLPAGLVPVADPFPDSDLPEVEILVGDATNFRKDTSSETKLDSEEESTDLYKPKVSTWGVFPRPNNISRTFGGGRTIRPGDVLEAPEDKAAKEARTRQLVAAYKRKMGLNMDPKLKADCEKALKDGNSLMDVGRLKEALPFYQDVMDKLAFQTELHGLAALQWSICQDSLNSPEKARLMYEKLQSHPNAKVSKQARQFMFSFQAMEMMKVTRSSRSPKNTGYQEYFEAFVEDKPNYISGSPEAKEDTLNQALPYIIFLASPILLVLLVAVTKGT